MNFDLDNEWDLSISEFTFNAIRVIHNNQNRETEPINGEFTMVISDNMVVGITICENEIIDLRINGKPIAHQVPEQKPFKEVTDAFSFYYSIRKEYPCVTLGQYPVPDPNSFEKERFIYVVSFDDYNQNGCCWYDEECNKYHETN